MRRMTVDDSKQIRRGSVRYTLSSASWVVSEISRSTLVSFSEEGSYGIQIGPQLSVCY